MDNGKATIIASVIAAIATLAAAVIGLYGVTLQKENSVLQQENTSLQQENFELQEQTSDKDNDDLQMQISVLVSEISKLKENNSDLNAQVEALESEKSQLEEELSILRNSSEKPMTGLKATDDLLSVCPPYQTSDRQYYREQEFFKMGNITYVNGFTMQDGAYALFNLGGQYKNLTFTLGHIDGTTMIDGVFHIYLDNELKDRIVVDCEALPNEYKLTLDNAQQMKIEKVDEATRNYQAGEWYGFANAKVD